MTSAVDLTQDESKMRWCGCGSCGGGGGREVRAGERGESSLVRVTGAEAAGAALLVLMSCLPSCSSPPASPTHSALAAGFVVAMLVQCFDHISGAMFNPTVTLAALIYGRISRIRAAAMVVAQLVGATLGASLLHLYRPPDAHALCVTLPQSGLSAYEAVVVEAAAGGCLALVNCAAWDARTDGLRDSWPLRIGATVTALSLVAGQLTGSSMNPARSFAPALVAGDWSHHWVYWVGPLGGGALFTVVYCAALRHLPARTLPPTHAHSLAFTHAHMPALTHASAHTDTPVGNKPPRDV